MYFVSYRSGLIGKDSNSTYSCTCVLYYVHIVLCKKLKIESVMHYRSFAVVQPAR